MRKLIVGARGSGLSVTQARWVMGRIRAAHPDVEIEFRKITTSGDRDQRAAPPLGTVGFFTKEIERALIAGEIDVAVHSMKDLPTSLPEGCAIGAVTERVDPRDAFLSKSGKVLRELPPGSTIGTSSPRRAAQLRHAFGHLAIAPLRGNLDTRIRKMREGIVDGIIVALAGLVRLSLDAQVTEILPADLMLPAAGQGALAVEVRSDDEVTRKLAAVLNHRPTEAAVRAERAVLGRLGAGCRVPAGCLGSVDGDVLRIDALVASLDGKVILRESARGPADRPEAPGIEAADRLLSAGAAALIAAGCDTGEVG